VIEVDMPADEPRESWRWPDQPYWLRWSYWKTWWFAPKIDVLGSSSTYDAAQEWAKRYLPTRDDDIYSAILKHAEGHYQLSLDMVNALDRKADDLMKFAGVIGAAIATAGRIAGMNGIVSGSRLFPLSVASLVVTVLIAARTRRPATMATALDISAAIEIADVSTVPPVVSDPPVDPSDWPPPTKFQFEAALAASYHAAATGLLVVIDWKASQLRRATFFFCLGMVLLALVYLRLLW